MNKKTRSVAKKHRKGRTRLKAKAKKLAAKRKPAKSAKGKK